MLTRPVIVASEIPGRAVSGQRRPPACHDFLNQSRNCGVALPMPGRHPAGDNPASMRFRTAARMPGSNDGLAAPWAGTTCGRAGTPACRLACCTHRGPETARRMPSAPESSPAGMLPHTVCNQAFPTRGYAANLHPCSSSLPGLNGASSRVPPAPTPATFTCPNTGPGSPA